MSGIEIAALALMWVYVMAFLLLTAEVSRASGSSVWLFSVGKERQTFPAMLFRSAFVHGLFMPPLAKWAAAAGYDIAAEPDLGRAADIVGLLLMAAGAAIALYSQSYMGRSWRIGAAEGRLGSIVDSGPFGLSRNPVFLGQALLFAGSLAAFSTLLQAAAVSALLAAIYMQVKIEERVLAKEFGQAHIDYKKRVRRWL